MLLVAPQAEKGCELGLRTGKPGLEAHALVYLERVFEVRGSLFVSSERAGK